MHAYVHVCIYVYECEAIHSACKHIGTVYVYTRVVGSNLEVVRPLLKGYGAMP